MSNAKELLQAANYAYRTEGNRARAESLVAEILISHPDSAEASYARKLLAAIQGGDSQTPLASSQALRTENERSRVDTSEARRPDLPRCYVVGTGFEGRATIIRKYCRETMDVQFRRERNNPHDENAVSVWVTIPGIIGVKHRQIGYLKKSHAARIAKVLDARHKLWAQIDEIYDPDGQAHPRVRLNVGYD